MLRLTPVISLPMPWVINMAVQELRLVKDILRITIMIGVPMTLLHGGCGEQRSQHHPLLPNIINPVERYTTALFTFTMWVILLVPWVITGRISILAGGVEALIPAIAQVYPVQVIVIQLLQTPVLMQPIMAFIGQLIPARNSPGDNFINDIQRISCLLSFA